MWFQRVTVVAGLCVACCWSLDVPDLPGYQKCANYLFNQVEDRLGKNITRLEAKITSVADQLNQLSAPATTPAAPQDTQQQTSAPNLMVALLEKIESMENLIKTKLNAMDERQAAVAAAAASRQQCVTKQEVEEMLAVRVEVVIDSLEAAAGQCASEEQVTHVLQEVQDVQDGVEQVAALTEQAKQGAKTCPQQSAQLIVSEVASLKVAVQQLGAKQVETEEFLQLMMEEIVNATQPPPLTTPPPPTTTTTTTTTTTKAPTTQPAAQVYPCEDSVFPRGPSHQYSLCETIVRINKCHVPAASYHCCHTCTSHNQLPVMGPWRYDNRPRVVNAFQLMGLLTHKG